MLRFDIFPKYGNRHQIGGCVCRPSASPASTQTSASYENSSSFSRLRASGVCASSSGDGLRKRPLSHSEMTRVRIQSAMGSTSNETRNDASQKVSPPSVKCHKPLQTSAAMRLYVYILIPYISFISFFDSANPLPPKRTATGVSYAAQTKNA